MSSKSFDILTNPFEAKNCYTCKREYGDKILRTSEHIFPSWLIKKYDLHNNEYINIDGKKKHYSKTKINICNFCNNNFFGAIEEKIMNNCATERETFIWMIKIYYLTIIFDEDFNKLESSERERWHRSNEDINYLSFLMCSIIDGYSDNFPYVMFEMDWDDGFDFHLRLNALEIFFNKRRIMIFFSINELQKAILEKYFEKMGNKVDFKKMSSISLDIEKIVGPFYRRCDISENKSLNYKIKYLNKVVKTHRIIIRKLLKEKNIDIDLNKFL